MKKYTRLVVLYRESVEVVPFEEGYEDEAEKFFEQARQNWSDVYLCQVLKGPGPQERIG